MPKPKTEQTRQKCPGGLSFNRRRDEHSLGKIQDIECYRCRKRMGCSACCEPARELICGVCRNWATKEAIEAHGPIVPRSKRAEATNVLRMVRERSCTVAEGCQLFESLWNLA